MGLFCGRAILFQAILWAGFFLGAIWSWAILTGHPVKDLGISVYNLVILVSDFLAMICTRSDLFMIFLYIMCISADFISCH